MEGKDHIYNGLGYITYALCLSDGAIQDNERNSVKEAIEKGAAKRNFNPYFADMIFRLAQMEKPSQTTAINLGFDEFKKHSYYLKAEVQEEFIDFLEEIARANPPIETNEQEIIDQVKSLFKTL